MYYNATVQWKICRSLKNHISLIFFTCRLKQSLAYKIGCWDKPRYILSTLALLRCLRHCEITSSHFKIQIIQYKVFLFFRHLILLEKYDVDMVLWWSL